MTVELDISRTFRNRSEVDKFKEDKSNTNFAIPFHCSLFFKGRFISYR